MREPRELAFDTRDGTALFYRHWPAVNGSARALLLLHRGHEHSGRLQHLVDELDLPGFDCFAWDARGHGRSPGPRGYSPGLGTSVGDLDTFVRHIERAHGIAPENLAVVAQSVGAVLAATWAHDFAPPVRCLVLAAPAFKVRLYVPFARPGLRLLHALRGHFYVNSYVKAHYLTHDPARVASFNADPLITRPIAVNMLLALYQAGERVVDDAAAITLPTQVLVSGADWVVHQAPQRAFYERLGAAVKEFHVFPGFFHDTFGEKDRAQPIAKGRAFILRCFETPPAPPELLDADRAGYTRDEFERLRTPLPAGSWKALQFAATRAGLKLGAKLSDAIRLGFDTGFDSGSMLDAVYRNRPSGRGPLGRLIDRLYLDSPGWAGIRVRKRHVEALLAQAIAALRAEGRAVRIVDIAAGHGRYVLEGIAALADRPDAVLLRDYSALNVAAGQRLIAEKGMQDFVRFEQGDAFDRASLATLAPRPTLAVVSGLYELFPDNAPLRASLAGLAEAVEPGGWLVYTGQPWHPQLELIARALTSHRDGAPWIMRRRTQAEMDQLVAAAGFTKAAELVDDAGIFTVSLAQRNRA
ncbi:alpha-beta hydrolase superfamily lysophospholipase [Plasticicumulans lactativorans]|uniref:Alpha-beta hydrolase superfamily lysophospholipase n=1 Tax=Plasticicumulans lactativorans TaxID=1133106 RepID=A0A4R2L4Y1_9GAMM|nr:bifunctional alpha/beta hydrolase/class I SAM-dependent methyltransferase [Plasticicumulans lactativorans]TCO81703.1 alpha-beta hydrolase superfamily lysophospholipase [Plasticicumulans lactativorans]